jgi:serine protease Do
MHPAEPSSPPQAVRHSSSRRTSSHASDLANPVQSSFARSWLPPMQLRGMAVAIAGCFALLSGGVLETTTAQEQTTQQQTPGDRDGTPTRNSSGEQAAQPTGETREEHAHDETPALGVIVSTCPGNAVCVHATIWGSPAQEADIREGDYILSINQQPVKSPRELQAAVRQVDPEQKVKLVVWRQGQELAKEVNLAQAAEELPQGHSAWLGVQLKDAQAGVRLDRVVRGSPAEKAGLNEGDVVTKLNGQAVEDVAAFIETVGDMGPGSELQLTIRREDQEETLTAQLGSIEDAPIAYLRHAFLAPQWEGQSATSQSADEVIDGTIDALREEMRELRRQVEELTGRNLRGNPRGNPNRLDRDNPPGNPGDGDGRLRRPRIPPQEDDRGAQLNMDSKSPNGHANRPLFVMQRGQNRGSANWDNRTLQNRNWYNDYRRNNRLSYPPIYRSPYYGNSYFRNGGRYFYYGNPNFNRNYGYGYGYPRGSGLRLNPNMGFYWY